jgi:hypothetical protein
VVKLKEVEEGLHQVRGDRLECQQKMEQEIKLVRDELQGVKNSNIEVGSNQSDEEEMKLQNGMDDMKEYIEK